MDSSLIEIKQNVFKLCSNLLNNEQSIDDDEDLFLMGLSSLDFLKLITSIEERYKVNFDEKRNLLIASVILVSGIGGLTLNVAGVSISGIAFSTVLGILMHLILGKTIEK